MDDLRILNELEVASIQIEEGHNLPHFLSFFTGLQKQPTVMEGKADDLLYSGDDVIITNPAAHINRLHCAQCNTSLRCTLVA